MIKNDYPLKKITTIGLGGICKEFFCPNDISDIDNFNILHCVSSYPLEYDLCNFEKFFYLKSIFKNVGYSGHAKGIYDAIFALSNGAKIVEKHFTTDNNLEGRDNKFALLPNELKLICEFEQTIKKMSLNKGLDLQECEVDVFNNYRERWRK